MKKELRLIFAIIFFLAGLGIASAYYPSVTNGENFVARYTYNSGSTYTTSFTGKTLTIESIECLSRQVLGPNDIFRIAFYASGAITTGNNPDNIFTAVYFYGENYNTLQSLHSKFVIKDSLSTIETHTTGNTITDNATNCIVTGFLLDNAKYEELASLQFYTGTGSMETTRTIAQWISEFNNADLFPMMNKLILVAVYYILIIGAVIFGLVYGFRFFKDKKNG